VRTEGSATFVWTVRDGFARRTAIVRGREIDTGVEIARGLREGDMVIVGPDGSLQDGEKVRLERP
jgi:hypothetical protein